MWSPTQNVPLWKCFGWLTFIPSWTKDFISLACPIHMHMETILTFLVLGLWDMASSNIRLDHVTTQYLCQHIEVSSQAHKRFDWDTKVKITVYFTKYIDIDIRDGASPILWRFPTHEPCLCFNVQGFLPASLLAGCKLWNGFPEWRRGSMRHRVMRHTPV